VTRLPVALLLHIERYNNIRLELFFKLLDWPCGLKSKHPRLWRKVNGEHNSLKVRQIKPALRRDINAWLLTYLRLIYLRIR